MTQDAFPESCDTKAKYKAGFAENREHWKKGKEQSWTEEEVIFAGNLLLQAKYAFNTNLKTQAVIGAVFSKKIARVFW